MFCAKCGQEQTSETLRYCSRCGFKLNSGGEAIPKRLFALVMYLALTACAITGVGSSVAGPGYMQIRVIIVAIAAFTFYLLFASDLKRIFDKLFSKNIETIQQMTSPTQDSALPPARSMPVPTPGSRQINTAEMSQPPSITEHTTRLLDEN